MGGSAGLLHRFCADLRLLWTEAGGPTLRVLASRVELGKSQVGAILSGRVRQLPDWDVVRELVDAFRCHAAEHGRTANLSLSTGIEEFWRPRYTMVEHAHRQVAVVAPHIVPRQLPPVVRHLSGRSSELDALTRLVSGAGVGTTPIALIDGTAGVGKTNS